MITQKRKTRKARVRAKISGTPERPRLSVFRSNKFIYAQLIDDTKGQTLAHAKGVQPAEVGKTIAESATKLKITAVVFDRSGYRYHGRVKALADAARESGLKI
jgi:large subunit ribosomal protein L18